MEIQDPPRSHTPEWRRHRRHSRRPFFGARGARYAQWTVIIVAAALLGRLVWQGMYSVLRPARRQVAARTAAPADRPLPVDAVPWQRDVLASLEEGRVAVKAGNITDAEVAADRAASTIVVARLRGENATPDFFAVASAALDRIVQQQPTNDRVIGHVTDARIELAVLRTWQGSSAAGTPDATPYINFGDNLPAGGGGSAAELYQRRPAGPTSAPAAQNSGQGSGAAATRNIPDHVAIESPRALAANQTLDPKLLGGNYLDATLMADSAEILLPPSSREVSDNVAIADLTISGAAQTLDNMHWKNVTFIGTRLRYEGGSIDLQNVHFVRCTFGFPSDARGGRLANAIALGQSSVAIE